MTEEIEHLSSYLKKKTTLLLPILLDNLVKEKNLKRETIETQYFEPTINQEKPGNAPENIEIPHKESTLSLLESPLINVAKQGRLKTPFSKKKEKVAPLQLDDDIQQLCYGDVITLHTWGQNNQRYELIVQDVIQSMAIFQEQASS